ncbi:unnamed protein product [Spirodela intermedia]|uniref:Uncharacterized protein n=1 Tax=Spirodela intermedia TaxID=51605 RepID=A0A7I8JTJ9_SPIIN|nr:unnamed protein product [Spirodela intermedia]CAA6673105.1 unnamed protein product [Spirodela intermedia]
MVSIDPILFSMFYSILVGEEPDSVFSNQILNPHHLLLEILGSLL